MLVAIFLATGAAGAEKLAAIRVTTFEVTDPGRIREVEAADEWHAQASEEDAEELSRDTWYALLALSAEEHQRKAGHGAPQVSERDLGQALEAMGFDGGHDGLLQDPGPRIARLRQLDLARDARILDATRGLTPSLVKECVVRAGHEVAAKGRDPGVDLERRGRGEAVFHAIHGPTAEAQLRMLNRLPAAFVQGLLAEAYGRVLAREILDIRMRELVAVSCLTVLELPLVLRAHGIAASRHGANREQLEAVIRRAGELTGCAVAPALKSVHAL